MLKYAKAYKVYAKYAKGRPRVNIFGFSKSKLLLYFSKFKEIGLSKNEKVIFKESL